MSVLGAVFLLQPVLRIRTLFEHSKKMVQQARKYVKECSIFKLFGEGTDCNKRFTPDGNMSKILTKIKLYNPMKGMNRSV